MDRLNRNIATASLLLLVIICGKSARADLGPEEYRLPLVGSYSIFRHDLLDRDSGRYQLDGHDSRLVENLKKVAVSGQIIVGTTEKGYFMVDTAQPDAEPQTFTDAEHWQAALKAAGVPANIQLNDPDVMAAAIPNWQLRPEGYRMMKRLFGWADADWTAIIELVAFVIVFVRSLLVRSSSSPLWVAILLGLFVNVVGEIMISGGGPRAFVGFFMFPFVYCLGGQFGRLMRKFIWEASMKRRTNGPLSPV